MNFTDRPLTKYLFCFLFFCGFFATAGIGPGIPFIQNKNQWDQRIKFKASIPAAEVILLRDRIQYLVKSEFNETEKGSGHKATIKAEGGHHHPANFESQLYEVNFVNASPAVWQESMGEGVTRYNYMLGNDKLKWGIGAHGYSSVIYHDLYCDIDLKVYSLDDKIKQDWIVKPHADPSAIAIEYNGVESIVLKEDNLVIETRVGEITELKPSAYQIIDGKRIDVPCSYRLNKFRLSYEFPHQYDPAYELVIDPILIFSAYSGSSYDNWGNTATYDEHGNVYSGGMVSNLFQGTGFPVTPGAYQTTYAGGNWDVAILKYDSSGSNLLYATYLGGDFTETPQSLLVNHAGELLILGATGSTNFPVTNGSAFSGGMGVDPLGGVPYPLGSDLFVAKLSEDGTTLLAGTYLGGSKNDGLNFVSGFMNAPGFVESPIARNYGDQLRGDIIADKNDFVYLASNTSSSDFPVINADINAQFKGGSHDAVLVKLQPDLSQVVWSRMLGGSSTDAAYSIKLDNTDGIYLAGGTSSSDFQGMNGLKPNFQGDVDGWIAHISGDGTQIIDATYLGTGFYDQAYLIDLNSANEVYAFGQTQGDYPVTGNVYTNPNSGQFLHKLSSDLRTTIFSTVIGSGTRSPNISPTAFLVSECNTIYLSGWGGAVNNVSQGNIIRNYVGGNTQGLPISSDAYQKATNGSDFYFMVLSGDAHTFLYGSFLGGTTSSTHVDGGTSRFDKRGIVYQAVCAGCRGFSDFPAVNVPLAHQKNKSANCNNAAFKFDLSSLKARIQTNTVKLKTPGITTFCFPDPVIFQNLSAGGQSFEWNLGDGTKFEKADTSLIIHNFKSPGQYSVKLKAFSQGTCKGKDSTVMVINVYRVLGEVGDDVLMCFDEGVKLTASGGSTYQWRNKEGDFNSQEAQPIVNPKQNSEYYATITDVHGCIKKDTIKVEVVPGIDLQFETSKIHDCNSRPRVHVKNLTDPKEDSFLDFGDGTTTDFPQDVHEYQKDGTYTIRVVGRKESCVYEKEIVLPFYDLRVPNVITPDQSLNDNDTFKIRYGDPDKTTADAGVKVSLIIYNRWGKKLYENADYRNEWSADGLAAGTYYYEADIDGEDVCKGWVQVIK